MGDPAVGNMPKTPGNFKSSSVLGFFEAKPYRKIVGKIEPAGLQRSTTGDVVRAGGQGTRDPGAGGEWPLPGETRIETGFQFRFERRGEMRPNGLRFKVEMQGRRTTWNQIPKLPKSQELKWQVKVATRQTLRNDGNTCPKAISRLRFHCVN